MAIASATECLFTSVGSVSESYRHLSFSLKKERHKQLCLHFSLARRSPCSEVLGQGSRCAPAVSRPSETLAVAIASRCFLPSWCQQFRVTLFLLEMVVYVCGQSRGISTASLSRAKAGVELATGAVFLWGSTRPWTLQGAKPCPPSPMERKMSVWSCRNTPGKNEAWRYPSGSNERARGQGQEKKKEHFFKECGRQLRHTATHSYHSSPAAAPYCSYILTLSLSFA